MIEQYSKQQLSILRYLNINERMQVPDEDIDTFKFLCRKELITLGFEGQNPNRYYYARLSPQGSSYLATLDTDTSRYDTPLKISKISLGVSVGAVILSAIAITVSIVSIYLQHSPQ